MEIMKSLTSGIEFLIVSLVASMVMLFLGIVYFGIMVWVIKATTTVFFGAGLSADWAVMAAALISTGAMLAGALEKK
jgi:type IV secretory pathway TrbL component